MSKQNLQPYKGARDFYPEDKAFQKWMFGVWRDVVERYGYVEYDAPILEPTDIYLMKGSQEIVDEQTYTFEDRGGRSVTIRTEMTPTVSRMIAGRRQELAYPARWYSIPNLWRYERMQRGRLREFWQLNVDVFGLVGIEAELEMLQIVDDIFSAVKAKRSMYEIRVNSRVLVNTVLQQAGLRDEECASAIRLIDKMQKMSAADFAAKLDDLTGSKEKSKQIVEFLAAKDVTELDLFLTKLESASALKELIARAKQLGIRNVVFAPDLMRGFDYYTDIVFEVFDKNPENNRSMFGGGRYDGLVGQFGAEPVPTVGFGMGDVTFQNFLEVHKLVPELKSSVEVTVISPLTTGQEGIDLVAIARELREEDVNVAVDYTGRKFDKQIKAADKAGSRYVLIAGEDEAKSEQYTLKDMKTGKEEKHSLSRIISIVKDARKK